MTSATASLYRETSPPSWLRDDLVCSWIGCVGPEGAPPADRVLPDGCVDLVWDGHRLIMAGPDETAVVLARRPGSTMVGVRLRPGRMPRLLQVAPVEIVGQRVELTALWGREAADFGERLDGVDSPAEACRLLGRHVASRLVDAVTPDPVIDALVHAFRRDAQITISRVSDDLGVSRRQLQRRAFDALGYTPKTFAGIVRFQRFVSLARRGPDSGLAALARAAGYADQAHLTRNCRRISGLTPRELRDWQRHVRFVQDGDGRGALSSPM